MRCPLHYCYDAVIVAVAGSLALLFVVALFLTFILVGVLGYHVARILMELFLIALDLI